MSAQPSYFQSLAEAMRLGLDRQLHELMDSDFPAKTPYNLTLLFLDYSEMLKSEIQNCTDINKLKFYCSTIQYFGDYLSFINGASYKATPLGLVQIIEDVYSSLEPGAELLISPTPEYNYQIIDIAPYLKDLFESSISDQTRGQLVTRIPPTLNLIQFPVIERSNILLHALFGHEIGHPVADEFLASHQQTAEYVAQQQKYIAQLNAAIKPELDKEQDPTTQLEIQAQAAKWLIDVTQRGLQELLSDCVNVYIFGPSALLAAHDVHATSSLDVAPSEPEFYPPGRWRLRLQYQVMGDEGYTEMLRAAVADTDAAAAVDDFLTYIAELIEDTNDKTIVEGIPITKLAYEWIELILPTAMQYAKEKVAAVAYVPKLIKQEVPELVQRLAYGLPPNEGGSYPEVKAVDWRSAILSGWIFQIAARSKYESESFGALRSDPRTLHEITLRGIEMIILSKELRAYQNGGTR